MRDDAAKAKRELGRAAHPAPGPEEYLSTGLTLLNLATYGRPDGGLQKGKIYRLVGRSSSGKTFVGRTVLAEAACSPAFDSHELVYDDVEGGALMDTGRFFGERLVARLVPPARVKGAPVYSHTVGDFYRRLTERLSAGRPVVWVEDSLDSLSPDLESKMTDGKAKAHSQGLRKLLAALESTGSILVLISQVRVDMRSPYGGDIASGGMAPEFYSTLEVWLRKVKTLKKSYKGKDYPVGIMVSARVKKNRLSGRDRTVFFPFYPNYGIDNIGANLLFLTGSKHWEKSKGNVVAPELDFAGPMAKLVTKVEEEGLEDDLARVVARVWQDIDRACFGERRKRYE